MPREQDIIAYLASQKGAMLEFLQRLVSQDSPSRDAERVNAVTGMVSAFLAQEGIAVHRVPNPVYGDGVRATVGPAAADGARPVVLLGHCDTVFPKGEAERRPFRVDGGHAYGPGVADMKGGVVINTFVLAALHRFGAAPQPVTGLFTVDEEIASPWSRAIIEDTCRDALAVLNTEPGRPNGNIVTGRNGGLFFRIDITGKAAHSGMNFATGISAVSEAARKIVALNALTDLERGITANAGVVGGGTTFNTVAASAFIEAEVRYRNRADRGYVRDEVERIAAAAFIPGTSAALSVHGEFPPMEESDGSRLLFGVYARAAADAGLTVNGEFSGGCSDAGFAALHGTPTLCALGPVGGHAHTSDEYLDIETLVPRAQALALTILRAGSAIA